MEYEPASNTPDDLLAFFTQNNAVAAMVGDQHERFAMLSDPEFVPLEDYRRAGIPGIREEQVETFAELTQINKDPYEAAGVAYEAADSELVKLEEELANIDEMEDERAAKIRAVADMTVALSPRSKEAVDQLTERHLVEIRTVKRAEALRRMEAAESRHAELAALIEVSGEAWPVPQLIDRRAALEPDVEIIDEIPIEPPTIDVDEVTPAEANFYGQTERASRMISDVLSGQKDVILSATDIGGMIYKDESHFVKKIDGKLVKLSPEEREYRLRHRVTSLLCKSKTMVPEFLEEDGLVLQFGVRHFISRTTGKHVAVDRRIYRAVEGVRGVDDLVEFVDTEEVDESDLKQIALLQVSEGRDDVQLERQAEIVATIKQLDGAKLLPQPGSRRPLKYLRHGLIKFPDRDPVRVRLEQAFSSENSRRPLTETEIICAAVRTNKSERKDANRARALEEMVHSILAEMSDDADELSVSA